MWKAELYSTIYSPHLCCCIFLLRIFKSHYPSSILLLSSFCCSHCCAKKKESPSLLHVFLLSQHAQKSRPFAEDSNNMTTERDYKIHCHSSSFFIQQILLIIANIDIKALPGSHETVQSFWEFRSGS